VTTSQDNLLHVVRRVDWRFLLPSPVLERVAYIGRAEGSLAAALRFTCASLTVLDPAHLDAPAGDFDLVVIERGTVEMVRRGAALLPPGGCLYAELAGRGGASLAAARALRGLGFRGAETYWHWPDFERATRILPLGEPQALAHSILKDRQGWQAAAVRGGVRALQSARLLDRALRYTSVVGRR